MDPRTSAQDVMRCDLCETAVVQMKCDTCFVNLCKACVGEHISADLSKSHKIVHFKDRKSTLLYPVCVTHDRKRCKMFCNQCDIPVCTKCLASTKHLGHILSEILQILDERRDSIIHEQIELKETIYPTYQNIAFDVQNRMSQVEKEYGDLSTAITKHGEDWHREIDKLVKKLKVEVDEMKNTQLQTVQKHLNEINKIISDIKDEINSLEDALESKDISKFCNFKSDLEKYRKLPTNIALSVPKFKPERIEGVLCKLFGFLTPRLITSDGYNHDNYSMKTPQKSPEAGCSWPVKQLLGEPQTIATLHTDKEYIQYHVAYQGDGKIWTCGGNNTIKLYSINQGSLLKSITTKSGLWPYDIAMTKSGHLVYTDYNDRTVNIVKNEKIEEVVRMKNWKPEGVCSASSGGFLVILMSKVKEQSKVVCYHGSKEINSIQFDDLGRPLYSNSKTKYITENRNLDICVSDSEAKALVVVNQAGKLRFRYTGHTPAPKNQPFSPLGITTDSQSHILTADFYNDCVHIIDQDGQFLRYIDCGLRQPWGLCVDANDNLFVALYEEKQVKKMKHMQ